MRRGVRKRGGALGPRLGTGCVSATARAATASPDELTDSGLGLFLIEELTAGWLVRPTAIGKEVVVVLPLDAGGLPEGDVLPYLPAVRPSLAAEFDQLDGGYGEFDRREHTKP